ncbi:organic hydroperoxide reductase OsmC/OhrA [Barrientosiimonas humi]|uniref:Organic hydroperoxide reductase OsmC/OhrA n=1 Tax=Barrientosiimonas humi TaxID=999931 RepID=A0A542XCV3_9MICO|nr:OsmC family protein [Barrientosiimonas humi]TQL33586.1 organic hydroperoxide reductase OsmC/OhrA [Barrientosiimonas humi]CAG7573574.1 hypothetical protein BH39T_PBIAJDOK_02210 [Barrientosiimonas humi]
MTEHDYAVSVAWTGNRGTGTSDYRGYGRDHLISASGLPDIAGSADRTFHGDRDRWNPEQLLLAALAQCHMLSYLHMAVRAGVVVTAYADAAEGTLGLNPDGSGQFTAATLRPRVTIDAGSDRDAALEAHHPAHEACFIARSVSFPVRVEPTVEVES